jgi:8-oxo-dGTP pyrophosphatase MutT (NUDIX family)
MEKELTDAVKIERRAVRAILMTPQREILLLRILPPDGSNPFWITPGGGLEDGESIEAGLRRELMEELGLTDFVIGPVVWLRQHTFNWAGRRFCQSEQYHIVHMDRFEPLITDETEAKTLDRFQWWQIQDLEHSRERLTPLSLSSIVNRYIAHGPPVEALPTEIVMD